MADYQLTETDHVVRTADGANISARSGTNRDWIEYQQWLADGGIPDPYVPPEQKPATKPAPETKRKK